MSVSPSTLTLNSFEATLQQLINKVTPVSIDHIVLNCMKSLLPTIQQIQLAIQNASKGNVLYGIDLRPILHSTGNPDNWSLEACSKTQSLGIIGKSPTA